MTRHGDSLLSADHARHALWEAFRSGALREGQFLSMSDLVDTLGCPIAAVREAVKHASVLGLVTTLPKRGVQVMAARPDAIRDCLDFRMVLDQEGARRRIASGALEGLAELRHAHEAMRDAAQSGDAGALSMEAIRTDLTLHDYLAGGLGNGHLSSAYEANRLRMAIIQNARPFLQDRIVSAMTEHLEVIDALELRDVGASVAAIRVHCEQTLRWLGAA